MGIKNGILVNKYITRATSMHNFNLLMEIQHLGSVCMSHVLSLIYVITVLTI